jgi:hypothetical protein
MIIKMFFFNKEIVPPHLIKIKFFIKKKTQSDLSYHRIGQISDLSYHRIDQISDDPSDQSDG